MSQKKNMPQIEKVTSLLDQSKLPEHAIKLSGARWLPWSNVALGCSMVVMFLSGLIIPGWVMATLPKTFFSLLFIFSLIGTFTFLNFKVINAFEKWTGERTSAPLKTKKECYALMRDCFGEEEAKTLSSALLTNASKYYFDQLLSELKKLASHLEQEKTRESDHHALLTEIFGGSEDLIRVSENGELISKPEAQEKRLTINP